MQGIKKAAVAMIVLFIGAWMIQSSRSSPNSSRPVLQSSNPGQAAFNRQTAVVNTTEAVSPIEINLLEVAEGLHFPELNRDILPENESVISLEEIAALQAESLKLPPSRQIWAPSNELTDVVPTSLVAGTSFPSIDFTNSGGGFAPPDPELAVGPDHIIAVTNVAFDIYDKAGNSLLPSGPVAFEDFFSGVTACDSGVFDPNALYDEKHDRFILGVDVRGDNYCLMVSKTSDPINGDWYVYPFPVGDGIFFDYPHAGVGEDAIYMGGNWFDGTPLTFADSRVWAFEKFAMYAGLEALSRTKNLGSAYFTPQPLNYHGWNQGTWPENGPHYFFSNLNYNGATYSIHSWDNPFGANTFSLVGIVNLNTATGVTAGYPIDVPQSGSSAKLQTNDWRVQDFEYRNGYGWVVDTIACNPGEGTVDCIRWAKIDPSTATVVDAGVYGSNDEYRFFGDLAVNICGDMAVGYTKSSSSMFPAVYVAGRESDDPAGSLQPELLLKAGEISYTSHNNDPAPHRWGDYTGMTIDPDGKTFWYLGEYSKNTGATVRWGTYIGSFAFPDCGVYKSFLPVLMTEVEGFDSQFNGDADGWVTHLGTWFIDSNSWYSSTGVAQQFATVSYDALFADLDFSVRMWRNGCGDGCPNSVIIRGIPDPLGSLSLWNTAYFFQYNRSGDVSVVKIDNGIVTSLLNWTANAAVNTGDAWNLVRVAADGDALKFYINGTLIWSGSDSSLVSGRVGFGFYKDGSAGNQLWVDWATLDPNPAPSSTFSGETDSITGPVIEGDLRQLLGP